MSDEKKESMSYKEYAKNFKKHTEAERERWDTDLNSCFPRIKESPEKMFEMQALALSYRHMLADEISLYMSRYYGENAKVKVQKRDRYVFYSTGCMPDGRKATAQEIARHSPIAGSKISKGEKDLVINGDLADQEYIIELLDTHVAFLRECIKTIDHTLYGIKNRLELMKLLTN